MSYGYSAQNNSTSVILPEGVYKIVVAAEPVTTAGIYYFNISAVLSFGSTSYYAQCFAGVLSNTGVVTNGMSDGEILNNGNTVGNTLSYQNLSITDQLQLAVGDTPVLNCITGYTQVYVSFPSLSAILVNNSSATPTMSTRASTPRVPLAEQLPR